MSQILPTYLVDQHGVPIDGTNPLPTSGGGGGGIVDQGKSNADPTKGWSTQLTDGSAFITPAKTGQLPTALGATTAAGSLSVGIATDQLSTLATQTTAAATLAQLDAKTSTLATAAKQPAIGTAGTPSADVLSVQGIASMTPVQVSQATASNLNATVVGAAASGAAAAGNPVLIGGLDTTNAHTIRTDSSGNLSIVGAGTAGSAVSTRPLQIGGSDGTNLQTLAVDTAGRIVTAPAKNAQLINTTTTGTTLKSGAGVLRGFVIQNASSGGSGGLYIYDNTAASGTAFVGMFTTQPLVVTGLNIPFSTGLTVQITTAACPILFMWD